MTDTSPFFDSPETGSNAGPLAGAPALVTGAAKRLGRAIALALAQRGHPVALHCHNSRDAAEELAEEIAQSGGRVAVIAADLADADEALSILPMAQAALGPIQILVNSAALFARDTAADMTAHGWDRQLAVNLRAPALLGQALAQALPGDRAGTILCLSDAGMGRPRTGLFSYAIAKAGLSELVTLQAASFAPRIRVNGIAPGWTLPDPGQEAAAFDAIRDRTILERGSRPEDIVAAALYLIDAPAITGTILPVDGGQRFGRTKPHGSPS